MPQSQELLEATLPVEKVVLSSLNALPAGLDLCQQDSVYPAASFPDFDLDRMLVLLVRAELDGAVEVLLLSRVPGGFFLELDGRVVDPATAVL